MKTSYFIIAESVHTFAEGKVVIVGTFDVISSPVFPFVFHPFGIAARVDANKDERGRKYQLDLTLKKSRSKHLILSIPWTFTFPKAKGREPSAAVFAFMLGPLEFKTAGDYVFELKSGRKCVARSPLYVRKKKEVSSGK